MNPKTLFLATALAILPAGAAFAQSAESAPDATTPPAGAEAPADAAAPAEPTDNSAPAATGAVSAATQADLKAGATVYDSSGATLGTIQSVTANGAVVASGTLRAEVPTASFAKNAQGLVIGLTKAEFEAAVNKAKS